MNKNWVKFGTYNCGSMYINLETAETKPLSQSFTPTLWVFATAEKSFLLKKKDRE